MVYQYFGSTTSNRMKDNKEQIFTFVREIYVSVVVTILSLVVTGMLLLLCWKDALSIEINRDGVLIISNVSYVDDSSSQVTEDQRTTLSAEHVLGFPEVNFGSHSTNTKETRPTPCPSLSCTIGSKLVITNPSPSHQLQHMCVDEESTLPLLVPSSGQQVNPEIKKFPADKFPYCCYNTACSICLEDFTKDEKLRLLPCGHIFHTSCILPWLTKRATSCPLCKKCLDCNNKSSCV